MGTIQEMQYKVGARVYNIMMANDLVPTCLEQMHRTLRRLLRL